MYVEKTLFAIWLFNTSHQNSNNDIEYLIKKIMEQHDNLIRRRTSVIQPLWIVIEKNKNV